MSQTTIRKRNQWMEGCLKGEDVFILAGGPSLRGFDLNRLTGRQVIAVNFSILHWPKAQYMCALDSKLFSGLRAEGINPYELKAKVIAGSCANMRPMRNVSVVVVGHRPSKDPRIMYGSKSSTLIAINFAIIAKAKRIYLLGVDQKYSPDHDQRSGKGVHFYDQFYPAQEYRHEDRYTKVAGAYRAFRGMGEIINLNPDSGVKCFPFGDIDEVLPPVKEAASA